MSKNVLVLGAGRVGLKCIQQLEKEGHNVTVIEKDKEKVDKAQKLTNAIVIKGDIADTKILQQSDLSDIDEILAVTGNVQANLSACLIVERKGYDAKTTLRVSSDQEKQNYESLVDRVVFPESAAALETVRYVDEMFNVIDQFGDRFDVCEVIVDENSPVANEKIKDCNIPGESLIIASNSEICSGDTVLEPDNRYLTICEPKYMEDINILFRE